MNRSKKIFIFEDGQVAYADTHPSIDVEMSVVSLKSGGIKRPDKRDANAQEQSILKNDIANAHYRDGVIVNDIINSEKDDSMKADKNNESEVS